MDNGRGGAGGSSWAHMPRAPCAQMLSRLFVCFVYSPGAARAQAKGGELRGGFGFAPAGRQVPPRRGPSPSGAALGPA
jgi:hypothetical protein